MAPHTLAVRQRILAMRQRILAMRQRTLTMRQRIGPAPLLPIEPISVKAKTAQKMGPAGRGEAIEARAICLLVRPAA